MVGVGDTPSASEDLPIIDRRARRMHAGDRYRLTAFGGLSALSLDALSSVAYGSEAIVLVLVTAGVSAISLTLPIACAITALLLVLVLSYRQVIAVHPDGGGAYAVAKRQLGRGAALLAAAPSRSSGPPTPPSIPSSPSESSWCSRRSRPVVRR